MCSMLPLLAPSMGHPWPIIGGGSPGGAASLLRSVGLGAFPLPLLVVLPQSFGASLSYTFAEPSLLWLLPGFGAARLGTGLALRAGELRLLALCLRCFRFPESPEGFLESEPPGFAVSEDQVNR